MAMTSMMRGHVRMFFVARTHSRARVSSKMRSTTRDDTITAMLSRTAPPLHQRAHVGYRTMEFECNFEILGDDGRQFRNSTDFPIIYPVHVITRKSLGLMTRKLSVTESHRSAQFRGTFSRRKPSVASANWAQVA